MVTVVTDIYETDRLRDWNLSKGIAERVRHLFGEEHLIDYVPHTIGDTSLGDGLITNIYSYYGAAVIVREWKLTEYDYSKSSPPSVPHQTGVVSCKWSCDNPIVNKYIAEGLEAIEGMKKNNINFNLPT
jgi:hypothetical protein